MINKAYTTEEKLEAFLKETITTGAADDAINQAVDLIDKYTGRNFIADTVASARLFNGDGKPELKIDDCVEISKVEAGQDYYGETKTEKLTTEYIKLPNNYSAKSLPITSLHLKNAFWLAGLQNHQITAKWGFSVTVPNGITFAATVLAAGIYNYNQSGGSGTVRSESIGNYSVTYSEEDESGWNAYNRAMEVLAGYKKWNI